MATRAAIKPRRRTVRAVDKVHHDAPRPSLAVSVARLALSRPAKAAYVAIGTAGLAALAVAFIGPKRLEKEVIRPLRGAIEPHTDRLWADAKPLREQVTRLIQSASPSGREKLVKSFQSWVGHFHAT